MLGLAYRVGVKLTSSLPPRARYGVAGAATAAFYEVFPGRRRASRHNYAAVLQRSEDDPMVARTVRAASANYGRMLADLFVIADLAPEQIKERVSVDGKEHLDAALAQGRGAILVLPHMGSWDVCGALGAIWGYQIVAVAERLPGSLNDEVVASRSRHGLRLVPMGRSAVRDLAEALQANQLVALVCDLPHGPGVEVDFFGHRATVPGGPAALSVRYRSPLLPVYCRAQGDGRYHVHIDPPIQPPERGSARSHDLSTELMQRVVRRFEDFIRAYPEHWYAFRPILR